MTDAIQHRLEDRLTPEQHKFLEDHEFKFADYFAYRSYGLIWKHKPALDLAREIRKMGLRAAVCRGTLTVFYPTA